MNWTFEHDVMLCREILVIEPFSFRYGSRERGQAWEKIAQNLNQSIYPKFNVDQRAVRDHFLKLDQSLKIEILQDTLHLSFPAEIDHTSIVANINVYFEDHEHRIIAKTLRHLGFLGHLRLPFRFLAYSLQ